MKFTIDRATLAKMVEQVVGKTRSRKPKEVSMQLSACVARVFVSANGLVAGHEALVFEDGECSVLGRRFLLVLKSYAYKRNLIIEVEQYLLRIGTFSMPIVDYSPCTHPPGNFRVYRVTDTWLGSRPEKGDK